MKLVMVYENETYFPREVGAGGIIFDPRGKTMSSYVWGLGRKINNEAE